MRLSKTNLKELAEYGLGAKLTPTIKRRRNNEESRMQQEVIRWWRGYSKEHNIPECLLFAIPNGSALGHGKEAYQVKQRQIRGSIMKREGLRPGCPDLFLAYTKFVPPTELGSRSGLFIEMKTTKGIESMEQLHFRRSLISHGYACYVCRSAEDAIQNIKEYLS